MYMQVNEYKEPVWSKRITDSPNLKCDYHEIMQLIKQLKRQVNKQIVAVS